MQRECERKGVGVVVVVVVVGGMTEVPVKLQEASD